MAEDVLAARFPTWLAVVVLVVVSFAAVVLVLNLMVEAAVESVRDFLLAVQLQVVALVVSVPLLLHHQS